MNFLDDDDTDVSVSTSVAEERTVVEEETTTTTTGKNKAVVVLAPSPEDLTRWLEGSGRCPPDEIRTHQRRGRCKACNLCRKCPPPPWCREGFHIGTRQKPIQQNDYQKKRKAIDENNAAARKPKKAPMQPPPIRPTTLPDYVVDLLNHSEADCLEKSRSLFGRGKTHRGTIEKNATVRTRWAKRFHELLEHLADVCIIDYESNQKKPTSTTGNAADNKQQNAAGAGAGADPTNTGTSTDPSAPAKNSKEEEEDDKTYALMKALTQRLAAKYLKDNDEQVKTNRENEALAQNLVQLAVKGSGESRRFALTVMGKSMTLKRLNARLDQNGNTQARAAQIAANKQKRNQARIRGAEQRIHTQLKNDDNGLSAALAQHAPALEPEVAKMKKYQVQNSSMAKYRKQFDELLVQGKNYERKKKETKKDRDRKATAPGGSKKKAASSGATTAQQSRVSDDGDDYETDVDETEGVTGKSQQQAQGITTATFQQPQPVVQQPWQVQHPRYYPPAAQAANFPTSRQIQQQPQFPFQHQQYPSI